MAVSETVCIAKIVRQSRISIDCFHAQLNTSLVSLKAVCLQAAFFRRLTKGRAVIACRLAPFVAALALKRKQFGYCKGLASLLI